MGLKINNTPRATRGVNHPANFAVGDVWEESLGASSFRWYWSGSYWLSQQVLEFKVNLTFANTTTLSECILPGSNLFLERHTICTLASGTFNTTNFLQVNLQRSNVTNVPTLLNQTVVNPSTNVIGTWGIQDSALNIHVDTLATDARFIRYTFQRVGSPGSFNAVACLKYRLARR